LEFIELCRNRNERLSFGVESKNLENFTKELNLEMVDLKVGKELGNNVPSYFAACCLKKN
jgi:hypothetical protein